MTCMSSNIFFPPFLIFPSFTWEETPYDITLTCRVCCRDFDIISSDIKTITQSQYPFGVTCESCRITLKKFQDDYTKKIHSPAAEQTQPKAPRREPKKQ